MRNQTSLGGIVRHFIRVYVIQWAIRKLFNRR